MKDFFEMIISIFVLFAVLISNLFSCEEKKYEFMQSEDQIQAIQIVEATYEWETKTPIQYILTEITDIPKFLNQLKAIEYSEPFLQNLHSITDSCIAIKVIYADADYELFNTAKKATFVNGIYDSTCATGVFDSDEFEALINLYLATASNPVYHYTHDKSRIQTIEIVETLQDSETRKYVIRTVKTIDDTKKFIEEFESIQYSHKYTNYEESFYNETPKKAIKIIYDNGDYEVLTHNIRFEEFVVIDFSTHHSYVGEFNEDEFNSLIERYMK